MQLFYLPNTNYTKSIIELNEEESNHIIKVLRKRKGDILQFTDGKGKAYTAEIIDNNIRTCKLQIITSETKEKHDYYLHVAIAPTKKMDRFEWFLEKATEIGIDEITPIICEHSERKKIKEERCNKILLSATKQSLRFHMPKLNKTTSFNMFIQNKYVGNKYIAHCNNIEKESLQALNTKNRTTILIGPEGDFTFKEIKDAGINNFKSVTLGMNRLRTETAGVIAVNIVSINNYNNIS